MPKRRTADDSKYVDGRFIVNPPKKVDTIALAMKIPQIVDHFDTSMVKQHQEKPDWKLYRLEMRENVPYIVREMCDRCGKVWVPPRWRKLRVFEDKELGSIYLETGLCKDCIDASVYVDKYLDGQALSEADAKDLFYKYAEEYERAWRLVIASAPKIAMTEQEWLHRCKFFAGCAVCGGQIEMRAKYFPTYLNGAHTAWNVIPMCNDCYIKHYSRRISLETRKVYRYRVFSSREFFNKSKTIRVFLLHEMEKHSIYMEPLEPFRRRFFETKVLEGSD